MLNLGENHRVSSVIRFRMHHCFVFFFRQVPIMQNWPMDCLRDEPGTCILHYFK